MINFERIGHLGLITLDRPKALNALNKEMIDCIHEILNECENDTSIQMLLIRSSHNGFFCAGGDIKALYTARDTCLEEKMSFFKTEYRMNYRLKTFSKPIVSLINGICMGGGVGLGMHVAYPIVGEDVVFAMPETLIGLFPDVGASFLLNQLPPVWRNYVGIFGGRLDAKDLAAFHLVEGILAKEKWSQLIDELTQVQDLKSCLEKYLTFPTVEMLHLPHPEFWRFEADDFRNLMENLAAAKASFFADVHQRQTHYSPLSMYVTFEQLHLTHGLGFKQCLELDYRLVQHFLSESDFFEGVRAQVIDKDKKPKWQYQDWREVPNELVKRFFYQDLIDDKHLF